MIVEQSIWSSITSSKALNSGGLKVAILRVRSPYVHLGNLKALELTVAMKYESSHVYKDISPKQTRGATST